MDDAKVFTARRWQLNTQPIVPEIVPMGPPDRFVPAIIPEELQGFKSVMTDTAGNYYLCGSELDKLYAREQEAK